MNGKIRKSLNERFRLFNKAKLSGKDSNKWKLFKKKRNYCTNIIREAKANYWKVKFQESNNSKTFWKTVKDFDGGKNVSRIASLLNEEKNLVTADLPKASVMNRFFAAVGEKLSLKHKKVVENTNINSHIYRVTPTISCVTPDFSLFEKSFCIGPKNWKIMWSR